MNKTKFIRELQRELGKDVTSRQAEHALNAVLETIARSVRRRSLVKSGALALSASSAAAPASYAIRKTAAGCWCMNRKP
ncbi:hypothetical protein M5E88_07635 [Akkermansia muciniphila]|nr:hypothetical protein M5E88_07635 [Akkermansia muciniphila]